MFRITPDFLERLAIGAGILGTGGGGNSYNGKLMALQQLSLGREIEVVYPLKASMDIGFAVRATAALGFIGLGTESLTPDWGQTVSDGRKYIRDAWWYSTFPGLAILLIVVGFNLLGDGLRDVLDPRSRKTG